MALPMMLPGLVLAEQELDENGKVAGEARGRATVLKFGKRSEFADISFYEGNKVLFYEYAAYDVTIDGKPYIVLKEDDIFGVLK